MVSNSLIRVLGKEEAKDNFGSSTEIIDLEFDIAGETMQFRIGVTEEQMKLADIVPLAQLVEKKIIEEVIARIERDGGRVTCRRGCSACCSYLVPVSVPEAFWLREEILAKGQSQRRQMVRTCLLASRRILKHEPPKLFLSQKPGTPEGLSDVDLISSWYKNLKVACPFLDNEICTIYEARPLACREHFVKGSASVCKSGRGRAEVVEIPVRMVDVLVQLAGELEGIDTEAVIMPLTLAWCEENIERSERTWPASVVVECFVEIIKAMTSKSSTEAIVLT